MKTRNSLSGVLALLSLLYFAGEICQQYTGIPHWIRWHLSDLGCVGAFVFLFRFIYEPLAVRSGVPDCRRKTTIMVIAIFAWLACLVFELGQEFRSGSGDFIDAICYTVALAAIGFAYWSDSRQVWEL